MALTRIQAQNYLSALAGICLAGDATTAAAGPPLAGEDPGILDPGQWEFIAAASGASFARSDLYELPALDVSLGLIEDHVQLSAAYHYVVIDPRGDGPESDFGNPELGIKWRFLYTDRLQMAVAAAYAFGISRSLAELGIGADTNVLEVPLALEYQVNPYLRFNGAISYVAVEGEDDRWGYSAALAWSISQRLELLGEIAGGTDEDFDTEVVDLRGGFDFAITDDFHVLFSVATGISEPTRAEELNYDAFLGLQFFF